MSKDNNTAIIDSIKELYKPEAITLANGREVVALPSGIKLEDTKKFNDIYLTAPERRKGTAVIKNIDSFIAHVNRFKDDDSAIFANNDRAAPSLTAVLDYHRVGSEGLPRFGEHRTKYSFPLSKEWLLWNKFNGETFTQAEFAEFIEDNILDVLSPVDGDIETNERIQKLRELLGGNFASPQKLVELSKGLAINEASKVKSATNLTTGEVSLIYETVHNDEAGAPVKVPNFFLIAIPVFESETNYLMAVRLRYKLRSGSINWNFQLCRVKNVFDDAFDGACKRAEIETSLPLFVGVPE